MFFNFEMLFDGLDIWMEIDDFFLFFFCKTKKDNPCHNKINNQSNQIKLNKKKKSGKDQKIYIDGFVIKGPRITSIGKNHT